MTHDAKSSHIGGCLSIADILAVLYTDVLKKEDHFILSKGHSCVALYAVLAEVGIIPLQSLKTFSCDGSQLSGHVDHHVSGIEISTGSLGHGLSMGCGMAIGDRKCVVVLMSDGECDEGSTWEAALFAHHHHLSNLTAIVDYNKIQSLGKTEDILSLEPFAAKWKAFGWHVTEIDGHDHKQIREALNPYPMLSGPRCIIAHTIKGKGVSFMEHQIAWHYKSVNDIELIRALEELQ
jgi:transketolase